MMRYVARQLVAAELAERCEVQVAYAIGRREPLAVFIDTFGTGCVPEARIAGWVREWAVEGGPLDLTPGGIIRNLDLRRPIYEPLAAYGHFGRTDLDVPWEATDLAGLLRDASGRE